MSAVEIPTTCLKCGAKIPKFRADQKDETVDEEEIK
jgi:hypothetical protein